MPCTRMLIASLPITIQESVTRILDGEVAMWYILKNKEQTTALPTAQMISKEKNCKLYDSIHIFIWSSGISKTHLW